MFCLLMFLVALEGVGGHIPRGGLLKFQGVSHIGFWVSGFLKRTLRGFSHGLGPLSSFGF